MISKSKHIIQLKLDQINIKIYHTILKMPKNRAKNAKK